MRRTALFDIRHKFAFGRWPRAARALRGGLLDVIYPPRCTCCGQPVRLPHLPCPQCLRALETPSLDYGCALLDRFVPSAPPLPIPVALWMFDKGGRLQRLHHALKYGNRPQAGPPLGRLLARHLQRSGVNGAALVCPVPLHPIRLLERGYNQSALLAEGLADALGLPVAPHLLTRRSFTVSQTRLDREARWGNVEGAFALTPPFVVQRQHVLLVDDIITTGATVMAAASVLQQAGVSGITIAALAFAR